MSGDGTQDLAGLADAVLEAPDSSAKELFALENLGDRATDNRALVIYRDPDSVLIADLSKQLETLLEENAHLREHIKVRNDLIGTMQDLIDYLTGTGNLAIIGDEMLKYLLRTAKLTVNNVGAELSIRINKNAENRLATVFQEPGLHTGQRAAKDAIL